MQSIETDSFTLPQSTDDVAPPGATRRRGNEWLVPLTGVGFFVIAVVLIAVGGQPKSADKPVSQVVGYYVDHKDRVQITALDQLGRAPAAHLLRRLSAQGAAGGRRRGEHPADRGVQRPAGGGDRTRHRRDDLVRAGRQGQRHRPERRAGASGAVRRRLPAARSSACWPSSGAPASRWSGPECCRSGWAG